MDGVLTREWWVLALQGALLIIYGILAFVWPLLTLGVLVILFGVLTLVTGIGSVIDAIRGRARYRLWWLQLISGLLGIGVGVVAILWTGLTAVALLYLMVAWALVLGIAEIVQAFRSETPQKARWPLGISGALFVVFGLLLLVLGPTGGLLALAWLIAIHAVAAGIFLLIAGFSLRGAGQELEGTASHPA